MLAESPTTGTAPELLVVEVLYVGYVSIKLQ